MRFRAVKRVPMNEVLDRVRAFEESQGDNLHKLQDDFNAGRLPRDQFDSYVEWRSMVHALHAAGEGEDFDYSAEGDLNITLSDWESLTPRRLELLDYLANQRASSINELAKKLHRDVKNTYTDLLHLQALGFISMTQMGKNRVPELLVQEVTVLLG